MAAITICSNHSSTTQYPPILPKSSPSHTKPLHHHHLHVSGKQEFAIYRRHLPLLLTLLPSLPLPPPAFAFNIGISGPKDWLREQKKKSIKYLLAPIDASLNLLQFAKQLLLAKESDEKQKDWERIQGLFRAASRDCVPEEMSSIVAFQSKTGVEVCTFKLVVKNASSLLDDNDPTKLKAEDMLGDLVRSFTVLNGMAKEANIQLVSDREKVADALLDTISSLHKFEQGIKGCIEV